jgi:hypothetical protein
VRDTFTIPNFDNKIVVKALEMRRLGVCSDKSSEWEATVRGKEDQGLWIGRHKRVVEVAGGVRVIPVE